MMHAEWADDGAFLSTDRFELMLRALHDLGWRPLHTDADPRYLRWCDWPDCLRSFNIVDGPEPGRDGAGWKRQTRGARVLLCPDHASTGHWPGTFRWERGDTTIGMSCGCGESVSDLSPTTIEVCTSWWRGHVREAVR